ncbi:MAG: galactokinase [Clostridia bacterium]|nr:galactokinase [Clostridia bacterium]
MNLNELRSGILRLDLSDYYPVRDRATARLISLVEMFREHFGTRDEVMLLSVPGRSEICGNHTDHNRGSVIAASIDRDILAIASRRSDGVVRLKSEGRREDSFKIDTAMDETAFPKFKSVALIAGVVRGFVERGYKVGGFDAYTITEVLSGSGLSSSAAFEVMVGNILNHLYNGGRIEAKELAKIAQYAENVYFGKPSGLMDQMACAHGGFIHIDFSGDEPVVTPLSLSLPELGYKLCIVGTGGSHSDLNEDYASIPREMRSVAEALGHSYLSEVTEEELMRSLADIRGKVSDRALLRAMHFLSECKRVGKMKEAIERGDIEAMLDIHRASGHSSFEYLQNVYTTKHKEQEMSLAIAVSESILGGSAASVRVHGGGFAGTIQVILPDAAVGEYVKRIEEIFGRGSAMVMNVRPHGAVRLL